MTSLLLTPHASAAFVGPEIVASSGLTAATAAATPFQNTTGDEQISVAAGEIVGCSAIMGWGGINNSGRGELQIISTDGQISASKITPDSGETLDSTTRVGVAVRNTSNVAKQFRMRFRKLSTASNNNCWLGNRFFTKASFVNLVDLHAKLKLNRIYILELHGGRNNSPNGIQTALNGITSTGGDRVFSSITLNTIVSKLSFSNNMGTCLFDFDGSFISIQ